MLTLRELKKMIQTPEKNEKIPTDKLLKERKIPVVASKKIGNGERMALVAVYQNGYAMYQTAGRVTVFPVSSCRYEYESVMNGKTVRMEESFFDEKEWYLSLLMIGEDRIVSNSLSRDRNHKCFSYHAIAEDYGELVVDVISSDREFIWIGRDRKPFDVVKSQFLKLNAEHIRFVMKCLRENTSKVVNIRQYLLTVLYNAPLTISNYYSALVQHDMYGNED